MKNYRLIKFFALDNKAKYLSALIYLSPKPKLGKIRVQPIYEISFKDNSEISEIINGGGGDTAALKIAYILSKRKIPFALFKLYCLLFVRVVDLFHFIAFVKKGLEICGKMMETLNDISEKIKALQNNNFESEDFAKFGNIMLLDFVGESYSKMPHEVEDLPYAYILNLAEMKMLRSLNEARQLKK